MSIKIIDLKRKDFNKARKFAIKGMNLSWYTTNAVELYFYSLYFWYDGISKATRALGAYKDDELVGVLLVNMKGEQKYYSSLWSKLFLKLTSSIINQNYESRGSEYDHVNMKMLEELKRTEQVDGELNFFAVNPEIKGQGIGTKLLKELEKLESGKKIYLYSDSGSTYQFYMHRGFLEKGRENIKVEVANEEVPLTCFLFSKTL
ncbi:GNAT family N-acetyltransferase [Cytobacillus sp. Sa5YUA1]|uniref:GNAT family N-acetyltransferase n=1 Tax=Cytobacillus stercorigallinarum TaxID=2762240 RepID=A0ABR8QPQ2_9BACI|nr:GNAT family N-acetyltransferase [Cytobacillus stercorigallinarum]MBD7937518.1 GNAT family N-acetyltransferase [Cytobacillus stercorigallinarum]